MISQNIPKLLQSVSRIMRNSPQQPRFDSNYKATAKKLSISLIGGVMVALGTSAAAQAATFVSTNDGKIGKIDPITGAFTQVASGNVAFTDIAIADNGKLYGINFSDLYEVDLNTGVYSHIGLFARDNDQRMNALTFANGTLYGAKGDRLYSFNLQTGAATPTIPTPGFNSSGDLIFDAANNRFLAISKGGMNGSDRLYSIDITNSTYLVLGDLGFKDVFGLTFENGNLFGYTKDRQQISINPVNGEGTFVRNITGTNAEIWGATFQPDPKPDRGKSVPEPSTVLGLLGVAGIGLSSRLKRKNPQITFVSRKNRR
ncbi:MAG TPA: hypothetical protein DCY88_34495 [Cyanobacteria bacterium UBA11372]|nr:hypothetical protein [Cyanobacteria bacterium UBA11372]